jgi:chromosome segregation ATPase
MTMSMEFWVGIASVIAAIVATQWTMSRGAREDARRRHEAHDRRDKELSEDIARIENLLHGLKEDLRIEIKENEQDLTTLRSEMQRDYVRMSALSEMRSEMRTDMANIFERLGGISRGLERLTGKVEVHMHEDEAK